MSLTTYQGPVAATARARSTKAAMTDLRRLVQQTADEVRDGGTVTLRQLFYALTVRGILEKTEAEYKRLAALTSVMRKSGTLPYEWLEDGTRVTWAQRVFASASDALLDLSRRYAVDPWVGYEHAVEIWLEKDALAGPVYDVTHGYCVPLRVQRGYASLSASYRAAKDIATRARNRQATVVFYLRDFDPSGADAARAAEQAVGDILESNFDTSRNVMHVEILALDAVHIQLWNLPTRPTKASDSRAASFASLVSVELDAIPPGKLRSLVEGAIKGMLPPAAMAIKQAEEESTRAYLASLAKTGIGGFRS